MDTAQKELWSITEDLKLRGYTLEDIEEIMSVPKGTVSDYLTGDRPIPSYALVLFRALQQFPVFDPESEPTNIDIDIKALANHVRDSFKTGPEEFRWVAAQ